MALLVSSLAGGLTAPSQSFGTLRSLCSCIPIREFSASQVLWAGEPGPGVSQSDPGFACGPLAAVSAHHHRGHLSGMRAAAHLEVPAQRNGGDSRDHRIRI